MKQHPIIKVLKNDTRYKLEAYEFVREALAYAQDKMGIDNSEVTDDDDQAAKERHLTGQQLCEASRKYALEEYGMMSRLVLESWGIYSTSDLGDVVYNMIEAQLMKKSESDRREDFNDVFDFVDAFESNFEIEVPDQSEK